jgi:hypothetical protein
VRRRDRHLPDCLSSVGLLSVGRLGNALDVQPLILLAGRHRWDIQRGAQVGRLHEKVSTWPTTASLMLPFAQPSTASGPSLQTARHVPFLGGGRPSLQKGARTPPIQFERESPQMRISRRWLSTFRSRPSYLLRWI